MAKKKETEKKIKPGTKALFYQESPRNGYWTKFVSYIKDTNNKHDYKYKTKLGAFKHVKLCTLKEALEIMGLNKIRK